MGLGLSLLLLLPLAAGLLVLLMMRSPWRGSGLCLRLPPGPLSLLGGLPRLSRGGLETRLGLRLFRLISKGELGLSLRRLRLSVLGGLLEVSLRFLQDSFLGGGLVPGLARLFRISFRKGLFLGLTRLLRISFRGGLLVGLASRLRISLRGGLELVGLFLLRHLISPRGGLELKLSRLRLLPSFRGGLLLRFSCRLLLALSRGELGDGLSLRRLIGDRLLLRSISVWLLGDDEDGRCHLPLGLKGGRIPDLRKIGDLDRDLRGERDLLGDRERLLPRGDGDLEDLLTTRTEGCRIKGRKQE